jgi:hypothetical protein
VGSNPAIKRGGELESNERSALSRFHGESGRDLLGLVPQNTFLHGNSSFA